MPIRTAILAGCLLTMLAESRADAQRRQGRAVKLPGAIEYTWKQIVTREAGPTAADEFARIILKGEPLPPASDAFGPCFERRPTKYSAEGKEVDIFEWVRVPNIPDDKCREPW